MTPLINSGWAAAAKPRSNSGFGLSSLFHNTPEKMPAAHSIFGPVRQPYFVNQL
jgi:hypothetical protein